MLAKQNPHLDGRVCEREERKVKVMRKFFAHFGIYYIYIEIYYATEACKSTEER